MYTIEKYAERVITRNINPNIRNIKTNSSVTNLFSIFYWETITTIEKLKLSPEIHVVDFWLPPWKLTYFESWIVQSFVLCSLSKQLHILFLNESSHMYGQKNSKTVSSSFFLLGLTTRRDASSKALREYTRRSTNHFGFRGRLQTLQFYCRTYMYNCTFKIHTSTNMSSFWMASGRWKKKWLHTRSKFCARSC